MLLKNNDEEAENNRIKSLIRCEPRTKKEDLKGMQNLIFENKLFKTKAESIRKY